MHIYAQIDDRGICIGICQLSDEVSNPSLVPITEYSDDYLWRKYEEGEWSEEKYESTPPTPEIDELTQLKLALADLAEAYEQSLTELQLALTEIAELITGGDE